MRPPPWAVEVPGEVVEVVRGAGSSRAGRAPITRDVTSPSRRAPRAEGRTRRALVAVVVLASLALPVGPAEARPTSLELPTPSTRSEVARARVQVADFVTRINALRAEQGLSQLQVSDELAAVAQAWTARMVAADRISHNPGLASEVPGDWTKLGENVGVGYDVDGLMDAFIASPSHYRNLVDPDWNYVAVAVQFSGEGRLFTTHNFMQLPTAPPTTAPAPPPTEPPRAEPPTTSPPTSAPPADTTPAPAAVPDPPARRSPERVGAVLDALRSLEP
ncbi:MAG: CAP domain-containing protein [Acidimicrobiia bacterium]